MRSKYESLVRRMGKKKALVAIGHKILIAAYFILKDKEPYLELGSEYLSSQNKSQKINRHIKYLKDLGAEVEIIKIA